LEIANIRFGNFLEKTRKRREKRKRERERERERERNAVIIKLT
jgi:hypothetical protein